MQPVYLIDSSIYIFRSYFALPDNWQSYEGYSTNAVNGFCNYLFKFLEQVKPTHVAAAFDESLGTGFRHQISSTYKANRELPDEALAFQLDNCRELSKLLGIRDFASEQFEADDLIGSLASFARQQGRVVSILSRDKDLAQLIRSGDQLWDFSYADPLGSAAIYQKMGVRPDQVADFLALTGDSSDNIAGVPGIGPKTAAAIFAQMNSLDEVFSRLDELANVPVRGAAKLADKIVKHTVTIELAKQLTAICEEVPLGISGDDLRWQGVQLNEFADFCARMGLSKHFITRAESLNENYCR
jgi:5'-3' exonuclease